MIGFSSACSFHGNRFTSSSVRRARSVPKCALKSSSSKQDSDGSTAASPKEPTSWNTGKVRASRPIRGVRRGAQGMVRIQGKVSRDAPQRMPPRIRITSGTARGRKLQSPSVYLRPMMAKVREAVFSMLSELGALRPDGAVLDLFAGLGSVGLEALSRGVGSAVFVDSAPDCVATIRANAAHCLLADRVQVVCERVDEFLPHARAANNDRPYTLITITPPYEEVDYSELLTIVAKSNAVGEGTFVVVEYPVELRELPPAIEHRLVGVRNRRYGRTMIAIYACQPSSDVELRPEEFTVMHRR